jgi:plastocyanin
LKAAKVERPTVSVDSASPRRPYRRFASGLFALALLLALVGLPLTANLRASNPEVLHPDGSVSLTVTVGTALAFTPADFEVQPGQTVILTVENLATESHTFTLSDVANWSFSSSNSTNDLVSFFAAHPPLVYVAINATAGWKQVVNFTAPKLGTYEYVCEINGHFQGGMYGFMGSGVAVGPPPPPPIPVGLYIIVGVIVSLVVLAIVLGFVVGQREGARHEMPPERLGYPEPAPPETPPPQRPLR